MPDAPRAPSPPRDIAPDASGQDKVRDIGEAARKAEADTSGEAREAIDRATAPNGQDAEE